MRVGVGYCSESIFAYGRLLKFYFMISNMNFQVLGHRLKKHITVLDEKRKIYHDIGNESCAPFVFPLLYLNLCVDYINSIRSHPNRNSLEHMALLSEGIMYMTGGDDDLIGAMFALVRDLCSTPPSMLLSPQDRIAHKSGRVNILLLVILHPIFERHHMVARALQRSMLLSDTTLDTKMPQPPSKIELLGKKKTPHYLFINYYICKHRLLPDEFY